MGRDELRLLREAWNDTAAVVAGAVDSLSVGLVDLKVIMSLPAHSSEDLPAHLAWMSEGVPSMAKYAQAFTRVSAQTAWRGVFLSLFQVSCTHLPRVKDVVGGLPSTSLDFHHEVKHVKTPSLAFHHYCAVHGLDVARGMGAASGDSAAAIRAKKYSTEGSSGTEGELSG
jgi:hypothetical protein